MLLGAALSAGCACRREASEAERDGARRILAATESVDRSLAAFEAGLASPDAVSRRASAETVLSDALRARDALEREPPTARLVSARNEQLAYLNHLVPGFRAYLDSGGRDPSTLEDLRSIIRRGRAHRRRALDLMRDAGISVEVERPGTEK